MEGIWSLNNWKSRLSAENLVHPAGLMLYLAVVFLPAGALIALSIISFIGNPFYYLDYLIPGLRQLSLFFNSICISFAVAAGTMTVGFLAATFLWRIKSKTISKLKWLIFILIPVPPYVYALSWSSFADLTGITFTGWSAVFFVYLMSFLPFAVLISLIGLDSVKDEFIYAGRVYSPDFVVFTGIILRLAKPALVAGGIIIFLLCLMDYSVPSLFSENVYPLEIFAEYSSTGDISGAFLMALPLLLISAVLIFPVARSIREISWEFSRAGDKKKTGIRLPLWFYSITFLAVLLVVLQILVLFGTLIGETGSPGAFSSSILNASDDLRTTLLICLVSSVVWMPAALAVSKELSGKSKFSKIWWLFVLFPLVLPPPLIGMGLIALWNGFMPLTLHGTLFVPVFALLSRFTPFAVIILFAFTKSQDMLLFDAGQVFSIGYLDSLKSIFLPLFMPGIAGASALFFALGLGELGATLIVMPPGDATLTMRIYNYLHYGGSETVAGLCLLMTIMTAIGGLIVLYAIGKNMGYRRKTDD